MRTLESGQLAFLLLDAVSILTRAIAVPFQGESPRVAGREDFIAMKLFAGGPQGLSDVRRAVAGYACHRTELAGPV